MRRVTNQDLLVSVIATGLATLGSATAAAEYRLVVELRPDQQQSHLEQIAAEVFDATIEIAPMFPEISRKRRRELIGKRIALLTRI
jgi:hypothetical protein